MEYDIDKIYDEYERLGDIFLEKINSCGISDIDLFQYPGHDLALVCFKSLSLNEIDFILNTYNLVVQFSAVEGFTEEASFVLESLIEIAHSDISVLQKIKSGKEQGELMSGFNQNISQETEIKRI
jgi:hypothetical protein